MDCTKILFIANGEIKDKVSDYWIDHSRGKVNIRFKGSQKVYPYHQANVRMLKEPEIIAASAKIFKTKNDKTLEPVHIKRASKIIANMITERKTISSLS